MPVFRIIISVLLIFIFRNDLAAQQRPNIILILSDDAGYADFSFQSDRLVSTPNIDRIAREGAKFTNGYVTGAVCSPSRAGMLTGIYQAKFGHTTNFIQGVQYDIPMDSLGLPLQQKLVGDHLRPLGYRTGIVGKWHLGLSAPFHPNKRGFDYFWGFLWGSSNYEIDKKRDIEENGVSVDAGKVPYTTDAIGDKSVEFIKSNKDKPFFLFVSFNAPHTPLQGKPELVERFTRQLNDPKRAQNAALTYNMDENVGKIFSALEQTGILNNTIIIFTNDNGGQETHSFADNHPLRGMKADVYEGGIRVPMAIRWPGHIPKGTTVNTPVTSLDFLPTFLKAAGADPMSKSYDGLDGKDLVAIIKQSDKKVQERSLFWYVNVNKGCMRKGDYKIIFLPKESPQLYNLRLDIGETTDLASVEPKIVAEMTREFMAWRKQLPAPKWRPIGKAEVVE